MRGTLLQLVDLPNHEDTINVEALRNALKDFFESRIDQQELNEICIQWTYHYCFNQKMFPEPIISKPIAVEAYEKLTKIERKEMNPIKKEKVREIKHEWLDKVGKARATNRRRYETLKEMERYFQWKGNHGRSEEVGSRARIFVGTM